MIPARPATVLLLILAGCSSDAWPQNSSPRAAGPAAEPKDEALISPSRPTTSGFKWTHRAGPDFDLCYAENPSRKGFFGLYLGDYPRFTPPASGKGISGRFGRWKVEWFTTAAKDRQLSLVRQAVFDLGANWGKAHVWVHAQDEAEMSLLLGILEKLEVGPPAQQVESARVPESPPRVQGGQR